MIKRRHVIAVVFFLLPAIFHALALHWPNISLPESPETHLFFALVNCWFAHTVAVPTFTFPSSHLYAALGALTLHQFIVHGFLLVEALVQGRFDVQSALVLAGLIATWILLLTDPERKALP